MYVYIYKYINYTKYTNIAKYTTCTKYGLWKTSIYQNKNDVSKNKKQKTNDRLCRKYFGIVGVFCTINRYF